MGRKEKNISVPADLVNKIRNDIKGNGIKFYTTDTVPAVVKDSNLLPPNVLDKCTSVVVAASGCCEENRDYIFLAGTRLDEENGQLVTDIDPIIMVYDNTTQSPEPSGVVRFHGDFEGRTEPLEINTINISTKQIRNQIAGEELKFEEAPKRFIKAMRYMVRKYRKNIDNL